MEVILNKAVAKKILSVVDKGLVKGLGTAVPGNMCVEAAVNYAMGMPHGDRPKCVGSQVRDFKISLNDSWWPNDKERTKGMRKLAIAQLGSDTLDQKVFLHIVGFKCMTKVLPVLLANSLKEDKDNEFFKEYVDAKALTLVIKELKSAKDFKSAKKVAEKAWKIYSASASASAYAYAYAYASASASASAYAYASASASASASAYAYAYAKKNKVFTLKVLNLIAKQGLDTLIEMKSPGVKWLSLCD